MNKEQSAGKSLRGSDSYQKIYFVFHSIVLSNYCNCMYRISGVSGSIQSN